MFDLYTPGKPQEFTQSLEGRQLRRKQNLKEYCLKHTFNKSLAPEDLRFVAVDDDLKLIYCVIPKVATTTWQEVLYQPRGISPRINRWNVWRRLQNYTEEERSQRLKMYFKFLFVREPLQRILSAYKFIFGEKLAHHFRHRNVRKNIVRALRYQDFETEGNGITFSELLKYFADRENEPRNQHWRQYEKLCHPCVINYDFIGHFETMDEDAPLLLKLAGIDHRTTFPQIHRSTDTSEVLQYYSQVPPEYLSRIGEQYRSDFEMFGYEYLGPVKPLLN